MSAEEVVPSTSGETRSELKKEFVCKEDFDREIQKISEGKRMKDKPLWTAERIENVIKLVEEYRSAPVLNKSRNRHQYYYGAKYDIMTIGQSKVLILKRQSESNSIIEIIPSEDYYRVLTNCHEATGHGGRDKMLFSLKSKYFIPTQVVTTFLKLCRVCTSKKSFPKKGIVVRPITSSEFHSRGQVDLIDLQSTPDERYKWLLHYQDHLTKFTFLRPLTSKRAAEVAIEILKIFLEVGCPNILQSDNGREFTAAVIKELVSMWPSCKIVNGRPRHPASQGSVERANQDVENMLRSWLVDNNSKKWSIGCYFVQFQKNSSFHRTIQRTPYKALFGTDPRVGLEATHIPANLLNKIMTEEDLEELLIKYIESSQEAEVLTKKNESAPETIGSDERNDVAEQVKDLQNVHLTKCPVDKDDDVQSAAWKEDFTTETDMEVKSVQRENSVDKNIVEKLICQVCNNESDGAHTYKNFSQPFCGDGIGYEGCGSKMICYLCSMEKSVIQERNKANLNQVMFAEKMKSASLTKFVDVKINDTVLIDIPKVDRGPLDSKNILGIILDIKNGLYKVGSSAGILKDWLPRNSILKADTTFTDSVPQIELSLRELAGRISTFGGQGFKKCFCEKSKVQCKTKRCICKKLNILCNSRCHKSLPCANK